MDNKFFGEETAMKFLIVLGKMHASIFEKLDKHVKDLGINTTEFLVMFSIAANGKLTIQDIAERISVTSGNMTYTIDKLEKRNYLQRIRCSEDRRRIFIDFTQEGSDFWDEIIVDHMDYLNELFSDIDSKDLIQTINYMKQIGKSVSDK